MGRDATKMRGIEIKGQRKEKPRSRRGWLKGRGDRRRGGCIGNSVGSDGILASSRGRRSQ